MAVRYRSIHEGEWEAYLTLDAYAFGYRRTAESDGRLRSLKKREGTLAAIVDGQLVAQLHVRPLRLWIDGASVAAGGVSDVAAWPEYRRQGYTAELLRRSLARMRDEGMPLSMLYPSFYPLYQRFGWGLAGAYRRIRGRTADLQLRRVPREGGRVLRVPTDDPEPFAKLHQAWLSRANGAIERDPIWWRSYPLRPSEDGPVQGAIWEEVGKPGGYLLYEQPRSEGEGQRLRVRELVALTPDAYSGLLGFLARHDLVQSFEWLAPEDEPLASLIAEPETLRVDWKPSFMLRVVDLPPAMAARPAVVEGPLRLTLRVLDDDAPWNDGVWEIEREGGACSVRRGASEPGLTTDAATFAQLYNGFLSPAAALAGGAIEVDGPRSLALATRLFAVQARPYCADDF